MTDRASLFDISGKCVAITGGAGVLCGAMARALAAAGARVAVVDYNVAGAEALCAEIRDAGGEAVAVGANVLDKDAVEQSLADTLGALGRVDVLIFDLPADAIRWVFDLNCLGTILPSQVYGRHMAERGDGCIVNISSMNAFRPLTNIAAYSGAKAAVSNFTQWLAVYMAQRHSTDIRVNALAPGFFLTEQNRFLLTDQTTGEPTARGKLIIDHTPMGRYGEPAELIGTLIWLISDAARFVTGIVVPVDGGFSAFSGV